MTSTLPPPIRTVTCMISHEFWPCYGWNSCWIASQSFDSGAELVVYEFCSVLLGPDCPSLFGDILRGRLRKGVRLWFAEAPRETLQQESYPIHRKKQTRLTGQHQTKLGSPTGPWKYRYNWIVLQTLENCPSPQKKIIELHQIDGAFPSLPA